MRNWRIGTITAGILLITIGLLWILSNVIDLSLGTILTIGWPVLLILLGVEIILHHILRKETPLKFDGFSIFLVFAVGLISIVLYSMQSITFFSHFSTSYMTNAKEIEIADTIKVDETIKEIVIDIPNGDVVINGAATPDVIYDGKAFIGADSKKEAEELVKDYIRWKTEGDRLILEMKSNQPRVFNWNDFHVEVAIEVPDNRYIVTDMKNGKQLVSNLNNGADLSLTNGKLEAVNIKEEMTVTSSNGTILLDTISGNTIVNNTNGNIQITSIIGELAAKTTNGSIKVDDAALIDASTITSTNGSITVNLAELKDLEIDAKTINGSIKGTVHWESRDRDNKHNVAKYGAGTNRLTITTTNGSINVNGD